MSNPLSCKTIPVRIPFDYYNYILTPEAVQFNMMPNLPAEILLECSKYTRITEDLGSLAATARVFRDDAQSVLFHEANWRGHGQCGPDVDDDEEQGELHRAAQQVRLESIAADIRLSRMVQRSFSDGCPSFLVWYSNFKDHDTSIRYTASFISYLRCLASFSNLSSLSIGDHSITRDVVDCIAQIHSLRELFIQDCDIHACSTELSAPRLPNLKTFFYRHSTQRPRLWSLFREGVGHALPLVDMSTVQNLEIWHPDCWRIFSWMTSPAAGSGPEQPTFPALTSFTCTINTHLDDEHASLIQIQLANLLSYSPNLESLVLFPESNIDLSATAVLPHLKTLTAGLFTAASLFSTNRTPALKTLTAALSDIGMDFDRSDLIPVFDDICARSTLPATLEMITLEVQAYAAPGALVMLNASNLPLLHSLTLQLLENTDGERKRWSSYSPRYRTGKIEWKESRVGEALRTCWAEKGYEADVTYVSGYNIKFVVLSIAIGTTHIPKQVKVFKLLLGSGKERESANDMHNIGVALHAENPKVLISVGTYESDVVEEWQ